MRRTYQAIAAAVILGVLFWMFPLVHVVPLDGRSEIAAVGAFDADRFVGEFWSELLPASFSEASDADVVLTELLANPVQAREKHGRGNGVSRGFPVYIRGSGKVVSSNKKGVLIALGDDGQAKLLLQTGLIFGNAVRDATGLISSSEFVDSQQYNEISEQLNRMVEEQVVPELRRIAEPGKQIEFVACAVIKDPQRATLPLSVVPVAVTLE